MEITNEIRIFDSEQPVTEQSNALSKSIDMASSKEIVSILHKCDQEIFHGWKGTKGLADDSILNNIMMVAGKVSNVIKDPSSGMVVISGCGTSGRIAFLTARTFNKYLRSQNKEECFHYIIAGQDEALFTSQEIYEDDPHRGAMALKKVAEGKTNVVFIGVTCGLSAPFVAGQLDLCLSNLQKYTPVVLGFNPKHLARNQPIENWDKTFLQVIHHLMEAQKHSDGFILNPIIGPEPIQGSTRMKSGSASKIILETIFLIAVNDYSASSVLNLMKAYEQTCECIYTNNEQLAELIEYGRNSLLSGGHVYYIGKDGFGLMGMVDASECPVTYGVSPDDFRGFLHGDYTVMQNNDGNLSSRGSYYRISMEDFLVDVVPALKKEDIVIFLGEDACSNVDGLVFKALCKKVLLRFTPNPLNGQLEKFLNMDVKFQLNIPALSELTPHHAKVMFLTLLQEMAIKWTLNIFSTGSNIMIGKVFQNTMIDLKVNNHKLYHRAISIVKKFSQLSEEESEHCLLRAMYNQDDLQGTENCSVEDHIKNGARFDKIVPKAITIAVMKCSLETATAMIESHPILRKMFVDIIANKRLDSS